MDLDGAKCGYCLAPATMQVDCEYCGEVKLVLCDRHSELITVYRFECSFCGESD